MSMVSDYQASGQQDSDAQKYMILTIAGISIVLFLVYKLGGKK